MRQTPANNVSPISWCAQIQGGYYLSAISPLPLPIMKPGTNKLCREHNTHLSYLSRTYQSFCSHNIDRYFQRTDQISIQFNFCTANIYSCSLSLKGLNLLQSWVPFICVFYVLRKSGSLCTISPPAIDPIQIIFFWPIAQQDPVATPDPSRPLSAQ